MRAPRQARSAESYQRMLDAAEELLGEKSFDGTSVAEIAARAGLTIGAFYARFPDKDSLLRDLEDRMTTEFVELVDRTVVAERWTGKAVEQLLREHHRDLVRLYARRRAIARALVLRSHTDAALKKRLEKLNFTNMPRVARVVLEHARIKHPDPAGAMRFALLAVRSVCRETILFREGWPGGKPFAEDALADELTRLFLGYLGISPSAR